MWARNGDVFTVCGEAFKSLPHGMYNVDTDYNGSKLIRVEHKDESSFDLKNGPLQSVKKEVATFWESRKLYKKMGVSWKRSILLHGLPGCGKSQIINHIIRNHKGITLVVDDVGDFLAVIKDYKKFFDAPCMVVIEDIDSFMGYQQELLLELLDGHTDLGEELLFLSTTNNLNNIPDRIKKRPSRVDTLIEVKLPNKRQREEYLKCIGGKTEWAKDTNKFSLADLKELVVSQNIYQRPYDEALKRLR